MVSDKRFEKIILDAQRNEITEHIVYKNLAQLIKGHKNKEVLKRISNDEMKHYEFWKRYTNKEVKPSKIKFLKYFLISIIFGITFGMKIMEKSEEKAKTIYDNLSKFLPDVKSIVEDEDEHEKELMNLIDEERLRYVSSMVLGLNDALVELTGALAGFTLALQNTRIIAMTGLITGIAASLSMATSEYLSIKSEGNAKNPFKAALYTSIAYIITVLFLIFPYLIFTNAYICISLTIINAIVIIFIFTFYISVVKEFHFKKRFIEMMVISLTIAGLTFLIGFLIREFFNLELD
ncbi:MAG: VIT1/CCC1 transporter family protein [Nitrososphaerales archaeon]